MATIEATETELDRGALHTALESLGIAQEAFEVLQRQVTADIQRDIETAWMLTGFTDDALLDLSNITQHWLDLRAKIKGGLTQKESNLREAFGG